MAKRPEEEPLGYATGLQPPSDAAAQRAKPMFDRLVQEMRSQPAAPAAPTEAPTFGGGRRYDVALSMVSVPAAAVEETAVAESTRVVAAPPVALDDESTPSADVTQTQYAAVNPLPARPPAGAPVVRPPIRRPTMPVPVTEQLLEQTADTALLRHEPDGTMAFDIAFRDDVFDDLACTISVLKGRAIAIFRVRDDNTRRLIEAEAGRLRAGLEGRGLKVEDVRVVME